jgi:AcrR family transcriptional regulator
MRDDSKARRERVLATAAEVIRERGIAETRIADIGERAGMSAGHVMYYFASKDDLIREAIRWSEDRYYRDLVSELDQVSDPRDRLFRLVEKWCPAGSDLDEEAAWALWPDLLARAIRDPALASLREELDGRWVDYVTDLVTEIPRDRGAKRIDARGFAHMLGALLDGLAQRVMSGDPEVTPALMRSTVFDFTSRMLDLGNGIGEARGGSRGAAR